MTGVARSLALLVPLTTWGCGKTAPPPAAAPLSSSAASEAPTDVAADEPDPPNTMELVAGEPYRDADLRNIVATGASLQEGTERLFEQADLEGVNLSKSRIRAGNRAFGSARFGKAKLRGIEWIGGDSTFQRASFVDADLTNSTLTGGVSSFQFATFEGAKLVGAKLTGGPSSFQLANFREANLTGAVLIGEGAGLQSTNFDGAWLRNATISGSFQAVSLNGTHLEGANLTKLNARDLQSAKFSPQTPPVYSLTTQFPPGFHPDRAGWRQATQ
jgi:uncharacterized protein YjbI with pentapeptide repeats